MKERLIEFMSNDIIFFISFFVWINLEFSCILITKSHLVYFLNPSYGYSTYSSSITTTCLSGTNGDGFCRYDAGGTINWTDGFILYRSSLELFIESNIYFWIISNTL